MAHERRHLEVREGGYYRYLRRVPKDVQHLEGRKVIKVGLKTRDPLIAAAKARLLDRQYEDRWKGLMGGTAPDEAARFEAAVSLVRSLGLSFRTQAGILKGDPDELVDRLILADEHKHDRFFVDAILGMIGPPEITVSNLFTEYVRHREHQLSGYSPSQLRKHYNPKKRAAALLLQVVGDKQLAKIDREDVLTFRAWWVAKIEAENLTADAANRCISDIKGMLSALDEDLQTEFRSIWSNVRVKPTFKTRSKRRVPFSDEFIQNELLKEGALEHLNEQARLILYTLIETGARPSEICNLLPLHIRLDADIPHLKIEPTDDRILKTASASREIPLVGVSLWAMKQAPNGFPRYRGNEDAFSGAANKALELGNLRPEPGVTVYSIRHNFQDRILRAGALDRVQADLMGHSFERPKYGSGAGLQQKLEILNRIKFRWDR